MQQVQIRLHERDNYVYFTGKIIVCFLVKMEIGEKGTFVGIIDKERLPKSGTVEVAWQTIVRNRQSVINALTLPKGETPHQEDLKARVRRFNWQQAMLQKLVGDWSLNHDVPRKDKGAMRGMSIKDARSEFDTWITDVLENPERKEEARFLTYLSEEEIREAAFGLKDLLTKLDTQQLPDAA